MKIRVLKRKLNTLRTHPINVLRKYVLLTANKISSEKIELFTHDYEKFFKVENGGIVIDAGSCHGVFVKQVLGRASKIFAIEPAPQNLRYLFAIAEKHKNVEVFPYALWNEPCILSFNIYNDSELHSVFKSYSKKPIQTIKVKAVTLDSLTKNIGTIEFLKMDIEGAEATLQKTKKVAIASYHIREGVKTKEFVVSFLKNRKFNVVVDEMDIVYGMKN
jgi:FkbM family methyltransferase